MNHGVIIFLDKSLKMWLDNINIGALEHHYPPPSPHAPNFQYSQSILKYDMFFSCLRGQEEIGQYFVISHRLTTHYLVWLGCAP